MQKQQFKVKMKNISNSKQSLKWQKNAVGKAVEALLRLWLIANGNKEKFDLALRKVHFFHNGCKKIKISGTLGGIIVFTLRGFLGKCF